MKKRSLDKISKAELDWLGAEGADVHSEDTSPPRTPAGAVRAEGADVHSEDTSPLTPDSRRDVPRAAGKGGRPRIGAGAKRINITVEQTLLDKTDAYARLHGLTRAAVVAKALTLIVTA